MKSEYKLNYNMQEGDVKYIASKLDGIGEQSSKISRVKKLRKPPLAPMIFSPINKESGSNSFKMTRNGGDYVINGQVQGVMTPSRS
jgi:hypothetical protein